MEALPLIILLIAIVLTSKVSFKSWIAPPIIFSGIWGIALLLFSFRLINFSQLSWKAMAIIALAHLSFFIGAIQLPLLWKINTRKIVKSQDNLSQHIKKRILEISIVLLSIGGFIGALGFAAYLIQQMGSLRVLLYRSGEVRLALLSGNLIFPGPARILNTLNYPAALLAGIYMGGFSSKKFFAYLPVLGILLGSLVGMGRVGIIFGLFYYLNGFFLTRVFLNASLKIKLKNAVSIFLIILIFLIGSGLARQLRGGFDKFYYTTVQFEEYTKIPAPSGILASGFISYYYYFVATLPAFSQYLDIRRGKSLELGRSSFNPLFEILHRLGLPISYEFNYIYYPVYIPSPFNVYTILRHLLEDFGFLGILLVLYLFGLISSYLFFCAFIKKKMIALVILACLFLYLEYSLFLSAAIYMSWWIAIIVSTSIIFLARRKKISRPQ